MCCDTGPGQSSGSETSTSGTAVTTEDRTSSSSSSVAREMQAQLIMWAILGCPIMFSWDVTGIATDGCTHAYCTHRPLAHKLLFTVRTEL
jgi:hypothetical protein